jgi:outer membrane murein-binding lipoprotein Lpp
MADWLIFLLKLGGFGAVLVLALIVMGKWLLKQIAAALNSYVTAYAQETAKIDARIKHLEKLAEEQARLTRTVESIKDEIAAQAKSRDNRWNFWKDVYVALINDTTGWIRFYTNIKQTKTDARGEMNAESKAEFLQQHRTLTDTFMNHVCLARLTLATEAINAIDTTAKDLLTPMDLLSAAGLQTKIDTYISLRNLLCVAGRNQLWDTPEEKAKDEATT